MPSSPGTIVRPRTAGEILDDGWRLYLADAPLLLALTALFTVPAASALLLVLAMPTEKLPSGWWLPALAATLLPLIGLGSGAAQELLQRRVEGEVVTLGICLRASLRRGLHHVSVAAVVLAAAGPGLLGLAYGVRRLVADPFSLLGLLLAALSLHGLGLAMWQCSAAHPILSAGDTRWSRALRLAAREAPRQAGKAVVVVVARFALLGFAAVNLHLVGGIALWVLEQLAGFDTARTAALLSLRNPAYLAGLTLLAWVLLAPYAEAVHYLLHADARARLDGIDLWYRVQHCFPIAERSRAGVLVGVVAGLLAAAGSVHAGDARLPVVQEARREVQTVQREVRETEPYPGGGRWAPRLEQVAERLEKSTGDRERSRWFRSALDGFPQRNRDGALHVLDELDRRLALLEESLTPPEGAGGTPALSREQIRGLLPPDRESAEPAKERKPKKKEEPKEPPKERDRFEDRSLFKESRGPGVVAPAPAAGFGASLWIILGVLLGVVVVVAAVLAWRRAPATPSTTKPPEEGTTAPSLETILTQPDKYTVSGLWQQADELARAGQFREAVRTLYLAVLALLHRGNLIRCERTRTNGEYVQQLRSQRDVQRPFATLTNSFEVQWYGGGASLAMDYKTCRELADEVNAKLSRSAEGR